MFGFGKKNNSDNKQSSTQPTAKVSTSSSSSKKSNSSSSNGSSPTSVIANGTIIEGTVKTSENIRLDGSIIGDVECGKRIVMGETGNMKGNLDTQNTAIKGGFEGDLNIKGTIRLHKSANVNGTISAQKMIVEEGAVYNGKFNIGSKVSASPKSGAKPTPASTLSKRMVEKVPAK